MSRIPNDITGGGGAGRPGLVSPGSALQGGGLGVGSITRGLEKLGEVGLSIAKEIAKKKSIEREVSVTNQLDQFKLESEQDADLEPIEGHLAFTEKTKALSQSLGPKITPTLALRIEQANRDSARRSLAKQGEANFRVHEERIGQVDGVSDLGQINDDIHADRTLTLAMRDKLLVMSGKALSVRTGIAINGALDTFQASDPKSRDSKALSSSINSIIKDAKEDGMNNEDAQALAIEAIANSAIKHEDHRILEAFDHVKIIGGVLGQTQAARNARTTAAYHISRKTLAEDTRNLRLQDRKIKDQTNAIYGRAVTLLSEDPNADLSKLIDLQKQIDPSKAGQLIDIQNKFQDTENDEDVSAVNSLYVSMMSAPLAFNKSRITQSLIDGDINSRTATTMFADHERFVERKLNDPMLSDPIFLATVDKTFKALGGGEFLLNFSGEKIANAHEAKRSILQAALDWRETNKNGTLTDFREAMDEFAEKVLIRMSPSIESKLKFSPGDGPTDTAKPQPHVQLVDPLLKGQP